MEVISIFTARLVWARALVITTMIFVFSKAGAAVGIKRSTDENLRARHSLFFSIPIQNRVTALINVFQQQTNAFRVCSEWPFTRLEVGIGVPVAHCRCVYRCSLSGSNRFGVGPAARGLYLPHTLAER